MTDHIHEARAIADTLLRAFPDGAPKCWPETMQAVVSHSLRLADLVADLLPALTESIAEGAEATLAAHEQLNGMQTNLEQLGQGAN